MSCHGEIVRSLHSTQPLCVVLKAIVFRQSRHRVASLRDIVKLIDNGSALVSSPTLNLLAGNRPQPGALRVLVHAQTPSERVTIASFPFSFSAFSQQKSHTANTKQRASSLSSFVSRSSIANESRNATQRNCFKYHSLLIKSPEIYYTCITPTLRYNHNRKYSHQHKLFSHTQSHIRLYLTSTSAKYYHHTSSQRTLRIHQVH